MRVLLVASYGPSLLNFRGPLIAALGAAGHEVHAAAPDLNVELQSGLERLGARVHDTPLERQGTGFLNDLKYLKTLTALYRLIQPGIVITYTIKPNIWGALAGAFTRTRTVALITGLGIVFTDTGQVNSIKSWLTKCIVHWLYRRASNRNWRVIFQNPDDLADFVAAGCLHDSTKVGMMNGSGVDLEQYPPRPLPPTPDFLMISRILGAKGVREYARAAMAVKQIYPHARFRLVGFYDKGPDAIPEAEVVEWMNGGIEYLGPSDNVQLHLAACRIFVLPSYREGTPRSVLEAMATGRAILTSDAPGCRETVVDGKNGFLIPVRNVDALANKMIELIENSQLVERMGTASLEIVQDKYDIKKVNYLLLKDLDLI